MAQYPLPATHKLQNKPVSGRRRISEITSHRLLIYSLMSRRWGRRLLASWLILAIVVLYDGLAFQDNRWLLLLLALLILWGFVTFWLPRCQVQVLADRLRLRGALKTLDIPFDDIAAVKITQMGQHFPVQELRFNELNLLSQVYRQSCLLIQTPKLSHLWSSQRLWFPRFLFSPREPALLLVVSDWPGLNQTLIGAWSAWQGLPSPLPAEAAVVSAPASSTSPGRNANNLFPRPPTAFSPQDEHAARKPLVLIADDNDQVRSQLYQLLTPHYRVITAADGAEALSQVYALRPDLVLTDLAMPRMDGQALLQAIHSDFDLSAIPVIVLTASNELNARIASLEAGADDFLTKPCSEQELLVRVRNLLHARAQERRLVELNQKLEARLEEQLAELVLSGDLRRFLPESVADSVLSGQIGPVEVFERRIITILFVDIVSFTTLTEVLQPNKLAAILNDYLREMTAIALVHGGMVDKFIGDGLMVVFGAPETSEPASQVLAAMQTAVAMLHQIEALGKRWQSVLPTQLQVRIGISTGPCTIGVFGSDMLKSYTAVGTPVNIASRLQGEARPQGILCSRAAYELAAHQVRATTRGALRLRGVRDPVEAYDILEVLG